MFKDDFVFERGLKFSSRFFETWTTFRTPCVRCLLDVYWVVLRSLETDAEDDYEYHDKDEDVVKKIIRLIRKLRTSTSVQQPTLATLRDLSRLLKDLIPRGVSQRDYRKEQSTLYMICQCIVLESATGGFFEDDGAVGLCTAMCTSGDITALAMYYSIFAAPGLLHLSAETEHFFVDTYAKMDIPARRAFLSTSVKLFRQYSGTDADTKDLPPLSPMKVCHVLLLTMNDGGPSQQDFLFDVRSEWQSVWASYCLFLGLTTQGRGSTPQADQNLATECLRLLRQRHATNVDTTVFSAINDADYKQLIDTLESMIPPRDDLRMDHAGAPMVNGLPPNGRPKYENGGS